MAQQLRNEGSTNEPLLETATGDQIWYPVFSPGTIVDARRLEVLYDVQTKTYFLFDISVSGLKPIYKLSPQTITEKEADTLFKSGQLPSSLQQPQSPAMKAFVQRFGLDSEKILSSLLAYHAVHDGVKVSMRKSPAPISLHEYYGTTISKKKDVPGFLNLLRPATEPAHRCTTVILCAEAVLFCQQCACFFGVRARGQILPGQLDYPGGMNYLRLPVGRVVLSKPVSDMVKAMIIDTPSKTVRKSAYQHLGGIFKINFGQTLPTVPAHVVLALLLACSLFVEKKGSRQSAEDAWGPVLFNAESLLARSLAGLKVGSVDSMDMKRTLEREHLHVGGIECFIRARFP